MQQNFLRHQDGKGPKASVQGFVQRQFAISWRKQTNYSHCYEVKEKTISVIGNASNELGNNNHFATSISLAKRQKVAKIVQVLGIRLIIR